MDYEHGFIVERKEVDEIIKKLENNKIQLVLGDPASGKSIILKNVGFKLANQNKNVYVVELKKHPQDEIKLFFETIPKIDDDSPIFIVDDAHLNISESERLIRNFKGRGKGNLIIGSRETTRITEGDPTKSSELELLSKTAIHIQAKDVTEEMIKTFLIKQYNLDEDRIKTASGNLKNFKKDLWNLSWALIAFDLDNYSVDENKIYRNIKKRIENISAEDVFLPLSVFFRYEIPIERKFLEKQMGIEEGIIEDLIGLQEIVKTEEIRKPTMLSLHHSSIADLYFGAYKNYPSFGEIIKEKILNGRNEKEIEYCFFYQYITTSELINPIEVVNKLSDFRNEKRGTTLLENLIKSKRIKKIIEEEIKRENDIDKIVKCIIFISQTNKEIASRIVESINVDLFLLKIENEKDISKISFCVDMISFFHKEWGYKLFTKINIDNTLLKLENEINIIKIETFLCNISNTNKEIGDTLLRRIDINKLLSKIEKEEDLKNVGFLVSDFFRLNSEVAIKLIDSLLLKIEKEVNIENIESCIESISRGNELVALKLIDNINFEILSSKFIKERDIKNISTFIIKISIISKKIVLNFVRRLEIDFIISRIEKEEDIEKIGGLVSTISNANGYIGKKLVSRININALLTKIEKESDIEMIGKFVSNISDANKEIGYKLVKELDFSILLKIEKEKDIEKMGEFISYIFNSNNKVGIKLVKSIDINVFLSLIGNEEDIERIGNILVCISKVNEEIGLKLAENISSKIENEKNIEKIGSFLSNVSRANKNIGFKFDTVGKVPKFI